MLRLVPLRRGLVLVLVAAVVLALVLVLILVLVLVTVVVLTIIMVISMTKIRIINDISFMSIATPVLVAIIIATAGMSTTYLIACCFIAGVMSK